MSKFYKCTADLQGGDFCVDETDTINGWRSTAIMFAWNDGLEEIVKELNSIADEDVMDLIAEVWQLQFEEVTEDEYRKFKENK